MSRPNNNRRLEKIMLLMERDGNLCQGKVNGKPCLHVFTSLNEIRVNHIDGNENNSPPDLSNENLVCNSCNYHIWLEMQKRMEGRDNQPARQDLYVCVSASPLTGAGAGTLADSDAPMQADPSPRADSLRGVPIEAQSEGNGNGNGHGKTVEDKDEVEVIHETRPFGEVYAVRKKKSAGEIAAEKTKTATIRVNDRCEKPFNRWLNEMLVRGSSYTIEEWKNGGANQFDCSPETIWRYLGKRLDLPDCNPINGDLTLAPFHGKQVIVFKNKPQ